IEGNLLAADQAIEKLALLHGPGSVDSEQVAGAVADSARFDIFALTDCALAGEAARAVRMLDGLRAEGAEPPVVLWALTRELRLVCVMAAEVADGGAVEAVFAAHRVWEKRKASLRAALRRHPPARWRGLLGRAARVERVIKGRAQGSVWDELLQLLLAIAGRPLFAPASGAQAAVRAQA
ncbi:MAG: DNA polymerase III subunit delta, partial [Pseudomonadota bacterium]